MKNTFTLKFFILNIWLLTMTVFGQNITTLGLGYGFTYATDITQDLDGNMFVCETTDELIMKIDGANKTRVISAGNGKPGAIALDNDGNLYVAYIGSGANSGKIFKMQTDGSNPVLFASPNTDITNLEFYGFNLWYTAPSLGQNLGKISLSDGTVSTINLPYNVANSSDFTFDNNGNSYFVSLNYDKVIKLNNTFSTYTLSDSGTNNICIDFRPSLGLVIGGMSDIVIMGVNGNVITNYPLPPSQVGQPFSPRAVEARALNNANFVFYDTDGKFRVYNFKYPDNTYTPRGSRFDAPTSITLDSQNNIYVNDHDVATGYNSIKKIVPNNGYFGGYQISNIWNTTNTLAGISHMSSTNYIYFGDKTDNVIRNVNTSGTIYGDYVTNLSNPYMMKTYNQTDYYTQRNYNYLVGRELTFPFGFTYTYLGLLNDAKGFDFDTAGNAYVADYGSSWIIKVNLSTGESIALASIGNNFYQPSSVAVDNIHNVMYIADTGNHVIKRMDLNGNNITIIGMGFSKPEGVFLNSTADKLYVADTGNNVVKIIDLSTLDLSQTSEEPDFIIYPNPTNDLVHLSSNENIKTIMLFDFSGKLIMNKENPGNEISLAGYPSGMYIMKMIFEDEKTAIRRILKE